MTDDRIEGSIRQGVGHVQDAVGGLVGDDRTQAKGKLNEAAGSVQDAFGKVKEHAQTIAGDATDSVKQAYATVDDKLREQPILGVVVGVALGVLIGVSLARPRHIYFPR